MKGNYEKMQPSKANRKKFDLCLAKAQVYEKQIADLLLNEKIEVKTEMNGLWQKSGNIAIEYRSRGKESGITTTEAYWWCHVLTDSNDDVYAMIFMKTSVLKDKLKLMMKKGTARIAKGGDDNTSQLILAKIGGLFA